MADRPVLPNLRIGDGEVQWREALKDFSGRFVADQFTWDPGNVAATSILTTTLTTSSYPEVKGLRAGMAIVLTPPSDIDDDLRVDAWWCATDDTLTIRLRNDTGSGIDQGSGNWSFMGVLT